MMGGGLGERERRNGKAPIELGDESSARPVITLSDSDSVGTIDAVRSPKLKSAAIDLVSERQNQQVLDKELSRLLSIFPNASPLVAAADLASQLKRTSPQKALARIIHRYMEHGVPNAEQVPHEGPKPDPPQAIEKPMDLFARPNLHRVGTSNHGERQVDFGYEVLPPEVNANYNLWTYYTLAKEFPRYPDADLKRALHENNNWFAPSYKAIRSDYIAALAAERRGHGKRQGRQQGYPKLNMLPRDSTPKPLEPCYIFERELLSIPNASAEGAKLVTNEFKIDNLSQCKTHMDACEGETFANIECGFGSSQCGTHMDASEGETSVHMECGTHMDASEGETSSDIESADIESGWYCRRCGNHMDACEVEAFIDIESGWSISYDRFEEMFQCAEVHVFCLACLRPRMEESTFDGSQASNSLPLMDTSDSEESFPWSEVKEALPVDVFAEYEQHQADSGDAVVPHSI